MVQKKFEKIYKRIIVLFTPQMFMFTKLLEIWVGDLGFGKNPLPDPRYRG
jgi:hypothetical protein